MAARVFISYAHKGQRLRDELKSQLPIMKHSHAIESCHDSKIAAGEEWVDTIDANLRTAVLIFLSVSADFLRSGPRRW